MLFRSASFRKRCRKDCFRDLSGRYTAIFAQDARGQGQNFQWRSEQVSVSRYQLANDGELLHVEHNR